MNQKKVNSSWNNKSQYDWELCCNINSDNPFFTQINNYNSNIKNAGYCVRCIKN